MSRSYSARSGDASECNLEKAKRSACTQSILRSVKVSGTRDKHNIGAPSTNMEETGILENHTLYSLVLPDFQPGRFFARLQSTD
jgi:hypothetical protein